MKSKPEMIRTEQAAVKADEIPESVVCELSASLLPAINAYFQRPGIKEEFEQWKVEYELRKKRRIQNRNAKCDKQYIE